VETHTDTAHLKDAVEPAETTKSDESHDKGVFVPYLRAGTADLNTTIALALISFTLIQIFGVQYSHLGYFKKFFNFSSPIDFFVGVLELISEIGKIISFAFRLFGNVFAGEVLLVVISALVPILIPMPFYGLEIFVGLVQALVFAMLSLVFYNIATQHH
jgi:F-type H+-transporting ATPase subunit a